MNNSEQLTGWPAALKYISQAGTTFVVLVVLAGVLYLESQERLASMNDRYELMTRLALATESNAKENGLMRAAVEVNNQIEVEMINRLAAAVDSATAVLSDIDKGLDDLNAQADRSNERQEREQE